MLKSINNIYRLYERRMIFGRLDDKQDAQNVVLNNHDKLKADPKNKELDQAAKADKNQCETKIANALKLLDNEEKTQYKVVYDKALKKATEKYNTGDKNAFKELSKKLDDNIRFGEQRKQMFDQIDKSHLAEIRKEKMKEGIKGLTKSKEIKSVSDKIKFLMSNADGLKQHMEIDNKIKNHLKTRAKIIDEKVDGVPLWGGEQSEFEGKKCTSEATKERDLWKRELTGAYRNGKIDVWGDAEQKINQRLDDLKNESKERRKVVNERLAIRKIFKGVDKKTVHNGVDLSLGIKDLIKDFATADINGRRGILSQIKNIAENKKITWWNGKEFRVNNPKGVDSSQAVKNYLEMTKSAIEGEFSFEASEKSKRSQIKRLGWNESYPQFKAEVDRLNLMPDHKIVKNWRNMFTDDLKTCEKAIIADAGEIENKIKQISHPKNGLDWPESLDAHREQLAIMNKMPKELLENNSKIKKTYELIKVNIVKCENELGLDKPEQSEEQSADLSDDQVFYDQIKKVTDSSTEAENEFLNIMTLNQQILKKEDSHRDQLVEDVQAKIMQEALSKDDINIDQQAAYELLNNQVSNSNEDQSDDQNSDQQSKEAENFFQADDSEDFINSITGNQKNVSSYIDNSNNSNNEIMVFAHQQKVNVSEYPIENLNNTEQGQRMIDVEDGNYPDLERKDQNRELIDQKRQDAIITQFNHQNVQPNGSFDNPDGQIVNLAQINKQEQVNNKSSLETNAQNQKLDNVHKEQKQVQDIAKQPSTVTATHEGLSVDVAKNKIKSQRESSEKNKIKQAVVNNQTIRNIDTASGHLDVRQRKNEVNLNFVRRMQDPALRARFTQFSKSLENDPTKSKSVLNHVLD